MIFTYKPALYLGTFLLCTLLTACSAGISPVSVIHDESSSSGSSISDTADEYDAGKAVSAYHTPDSASTSYNIMEAEPKDSSLIHSKAENKTGAAQTLYVRNSSIKPGDSIDTLLNNYGEPGRIASTEYDFEYYIYNNLYTRLLLIAVRDDTIIGFYTDSEDFSYNGISCGAELETVNLALDKSYALSDVLTYKNGEYTLKLLMDSSGTGAVTGIYLFSDTINKGEYTDKVKKDSELLVYDLTNSIRARHGLPLLSWSSSAANSSRKHSIDMAENDFFSHIGSDRTDPGSRLNAAGISYGAIGENIIAGYESTILSSHAWFNSPEHRKNILDKRFSNIGIGFEYRQNSTYKTYITQDFYR